MKSERQTAATLKREFDGAFAALPSSIAATEDFLAIRVAGDRYAVALAEVAGLHADRKVVPLPSRAPDLLGVAGLRGVLAPVYDLRLLLGYAGGSTPRWLLLTRADSVGLAFDQFEAHLRVDRAEGSRPAGEHARRHLRGTVLAVFSDGTSELLPVIDVASLLAAIAKER